MEAQALEQYVNELLQVQQYTDYAPNGCQVAGSTTINRLVMGVTASLALIRHAADCGADGIFVHHGYFWAAESAPLTGLKYARIAALIQHNLALFAYHLPLDAHPVLGNNACFGNLFGWIIQDHFGAQNLGCITVLENPVSLADLSTHIGCVLGRVPLVLAHESPAHIRRVAWCTGAAQNFFSSAIAAGADVFITGEVSEPQYHMACESGVAFIAAGHHATERYGVQAMAKHLQARWCIACSYFELYNPV